MERCSLDVHQPIYKFNGTTKRDATKSINVGSERSGRQVYVYTFRVYTRSKDEGEGERAREEVYPLDLTF